MSAEQYYNNAGPPAGPPPGQRGFGGYGGQQQGYGQPQGYGGYAPQAQYYPQQQQPVYVQNQQPHQGGGDAGDCCCGICLGCCALFACEELCGALMM